MRRRTTNRRATNSFIALATGLSVWIAFDLLWQFELQPDYECTVDGLFTRAVYVVGLAIFEAMKTLYDHQVFTWQTFGGISRYFVELLCRKRGLAELALRYTNNEYIWNDPVLSGQVEHKPRALSQNKLLRNFIPKKIRSRTPGEKANKERSLACLKAGSYDIFHPTYYDPYFLPHLNGRPFVLTVHDMIHELYPEHFHLNDPVSNDKKRLVEKAAHIIAVSETTKRDLVSIYGVDESRVSVVYHGSSLSSEGPEDDLSLPAEFVLMVGSRPSYKNCYFALRALSGLLKKRAGLSLVFAGGGPFSAGELSYFSNLGISDRVQYFPASNSALRALYRRAGVFIFPSLYEGFGIPVLEAFSCGCPVLASNTAALREVAGEAALYFEPKCPHDLATLVGRVLSEPELRTKLKQLGAERLRFFSWDRCAEQTMAVYADVLSRR